MRKTSLFLAFLSADQGHRGSGASWRGARGDDLRDAVLTAHNARKTLERIRAAGFPVLRKPVRPARLRALLGGGAGAPPSPPCVSEG